MERGRARPARPDPDLPETGSRGGPPARGRGRARPGEAFLHRKLGETLQATGDDKAALDAYDAGLKVHPESHDLRNGRWSCLNRLRAPRRDAGGSRARHRGRPDGRCRPLRPRHGCCGQGRVEIYLAALEREIAELPGDKILESAIAEARAGSRGRDEVALR